jgi:hypothetical protein
MQPYAPAFLLDGRKTEITPIRVEVEQSSLIIEQVIDVFLPDALALHLTLQVLQGLLDALVERLLVELEHPGDLGDREAVPLLHLDDDLVLGRNALEGLLQGLESPDPQGSFLSLDDTGVRPVTDGRKKLKHLLRLPVTWGARRQLGRDFVELLPGDLDLVVRPEDLDGFIEGVAVAKELFQERRHIPKALCQLGMAPLSPEAVLEITYLVLDYGCQVALEGAFPLKFSQRGVIVGHNLEPNFAQEVLLLLLPEVAPAAGLGRNLLDVGEVVEEELFGGHWGIRVRADRHGESESDSIGECWNRRGGAV